MFIAISQNQMKDIGDTEIFDTLKEVENTIPGNMTCVEDRSDQAEDTRDAIQRYEGTDRTIQVFHRRDR